MIILAYALSPARLLLNTNSNGTFPAQNLSHMEIDKGNTLTLVTTLEGHKDRVWNISWRPQGDLFATCSGDKTV